MTATAQNYGLESIILHHSFTQVKGRTIRIDCRERTHVGGVNGAGKTSILSLIPAFYGEEPERIVSKGSGRLSFLDYYLPSLQSLVIFEYSRHGGTCCSVMFRHHSGKLCYRFVEGSAADTFFAPEVVELLKAGGTADAVFEKLRDLKRNVSRIIDTITNYRAIIQRNPRLLKRSAADARRLRGLAADFGLGSADTHMSNIERLTHVVLNKNRLMSSFKAMICETQFENIHIHSRPKTIDESGLVSDIRSIKAFNKEEAKIRDCLQQENERQAILAASRRTVASLAASIEEASEHKTDIARDIAKLKECLDEESEQQRQTDDKIAGVLADKTYELKVKEGDLDAISKRREYFDTERAPELSQDLQNIGEYRRQKVDADSDLVGLTSKVTQVESEFKHEISQLKSAFSHEQGDRQRKTSDAENIRKDAANHHDKAMSSVDHDKTREIGQQREERGQERSIIQSQLARAETLRDNQSYSDEETGQIAAAEAAVQNAEEQAQHVSGELIDANRKKDQAREDRDTGQKHLLQAQEQVDTLTTALEDLQQQISPDNDTWLSALRKQDPNWAQGLAKIIHPDLLMRTDLNPSMHRTAAADRRQVMGWVLNTDAVSAPDFAATEQELQTRLSDIDQKRQAACKARDDTEKSARNRNDTYQSRCSAVEHMNTEKKLTDDSLTRQRHYLKTLREQVRQALTERKHDQGAKVTELQNRLKQFNTDSELGENAIIGQFSKRLIDLRNRWAEHESQLKLNIGHAEQRVQQALIEHDQRLELKQTAFNQRLENEGIDSGVVQQARAKAENLHKRVQLTEQAEPLVREYQNWLAKDWSRKDSLTGDCHLLEKQVVDIKSQRSESQRKYQERVKQVNADISQYHHKTSALVKQIEEAEGILNKFDAAADDMAMPGNIVNLTRELQDAYERLDKLRRDVMATFKRALTVLNQYNGTQIQSAWQKLSEFRRQRLTDPGQEYDEAFQLMQVQDLRALLDTDIPQLHFTLVDQFTSEANTLCRYFDSLETMAREVKTVSRDLRQKINTDQRIESLSDIQVVLRPRIEDDESWHPLKSFVVQWRDWHAVHRREMPDDNITMAFQLVSDTLKSASLGESVESMVDMHLTMKENGREAVIRNDNDFLTASSQGLTYLAIMAVFMGLTRYLCPDKNTRITWPIDELGTLSPNNIARMAEMLEHNNLTMISACPKLDRPLRKFFENKISLQHGRVHNFESAAPSASKSDLLASVTRQRPVTDSADDLFTIATEGSNHAN